MGLVRTAENMSGEKKQSVTLNDTRTHKNCRLRDRRRRETDSATEPGRGGWGEGEGAGVKVGRFLRKQSETRQNKRLR